MLKSIFYKYRKTGGNYQRDSLRKFPRTERFQIDCRGPPKGERGPGSTPGSPAQGSGVG